MAEKLDTEILMWMNQNFFTFGRIMSAYKTSPCGEVCVFNGNICTKEHGKIWYGDLNLTRDEAKLKELATKVGVDLYILKEKDARFETAENPKFENAVGIIKKD